LVLLCDRNRRLFGHFDDVIALWLHEGSGKDRWLWYEIARRLESNLCSLTKYSTAETLQTAIRLATPSSMENRFGKFGFDII